jgi:hypothetical protein
MNFKVIFLLFIVNFSSAKAESVLIESYNNSDTYISGIFFKAYNVAYERFKQKGYDLENYYIALHRTNNSIEVSFMLNPTLKNSKHSSSKIDYGEEINYAISLKDFHIT